MLIKYLEKVQQKKLRLKSFHLAHVPREQNSRADILAKLASPKKPGNYQTVIQETTRHPSINEIQVLAGETEAGCWMIDIVTYLKGERPQTMEAEARNLVKAASKYTLIVPELYKRGFSAPLLKCVTYSPAGGDSQGNT